MEEKRVLLSRSTVFTACILIFFGVGFFYISRVQNNGLDSLRRKKEIYQEYHVACTTTGPESVLADINRELQQWEEREKSNNNLNTSNINISNLNTDEEIDRIAALQNVKSWIEHCISYPDYLSKMESKVESSHDISIFQNKDSFAVENIEKARQDYSAAKSVQVSVGSGSSEAVFAVFDLTLISYFPILFGVMLVFKILEYRNKGAQHLIFSTMRGRRFLAFHQSCGLFLGIFLFTGVFYFVLLSVAFALYGGINDLESAMQSLPQLKEFPLPWSLGKFLVLYIIIYIIGVFLLSLLFWLIFLLIQKKNLALLIVGGILTVEYFFYRWIPAQGKWNLIKFINLFYLINPIEFYKTYRNIAIGNYLINCRELFKYYSVFGIALCNSLIFFKSGKKVERRYFGLEIWLSAKKEAVLGFSQRIVCNLSSTGLEMYKILIIQKGSIVLICFALYLSATIEQYDVYYSPLTRYMNQFYECFETASGQEVDAFILALENSLEEIEIDYQKALENYQKGKINADDMDNAQYAYEAHRVERDALPQIQEEWFEINQLRSKGINAQLVNPIGYEHLWGVTAWGFQRELGLSVLLILIVLLSGVFSDERQGGYHYLLFSLPLGREELFRKKRRAVFYLVCIIWILASGVEYTHIRINYFLPAWSSPVQSLPFFRDFPFSIPIISFYVMWNSMRFILIFAISGFIGMISSSLEWAKSILVNSICFLLPSAFYVLGFTALQFVTLILPFNASELLGRGASYGQVLLWDGILIVLGSAGWCYTKKNCCKVRQR